VGYYIRLLTPNPAVVSIDRIKGSLQSKIPTADIQSLTADGSSWTDFEIAQGEETLCVVSRALDSDADRLVQEELGEFASELEDAKPTNAARWVQDYLSKVRAIYAFQILGSVNTDERWDAIGAVTQCLQDAVGGIVQADGEGFSNEEGYHIVWQFSDKVTGKWNCAILSGDGSWKRFEMDLGSLEHRQAFWNGRVPT